MVPGLTPVWSLRQQPNNTAPRLRAQVGRTVLILIPKIFRALGLLPGRARPPLSLTRKPRGPPRSVPLERQLDQPVDQLTERQPAMLPHFRIHADRSEAGNGVDLVDIELPCGIFKKKVHACHALAVYGAITLDRQAPY